MPPYDNGILNGYTPPPYFQVVLLVPLILAFVYIDTIVAFLWRTYQRYRQRRWDVRKARRQARNQRINMERSAFPVRDYSDRQPMQWVPKPRIDIGIARLRAAGRGVRVGRR